MKKKVEFDLIVGYFLLIIGGCSFSYVVIALIVSIVSANSGFIVIVKNISSNSVLILLGVLLIRKKKTKNHYI
ncbi:MAG: hypothetical protein ACFFC3_17210 [Candidatus Odinarchaeota archaeon]